MRKKATGKKPAKVPAGKKVTYYKCQGGFERGGACESLLWQKVKHKGKTYIACAYHYYRYAQIRVMTKVVGYKCNGCGYPISKVCYEGNKGVCHHCLLSGAKRSKQIADERLEMQRAAIAEVKELLKKPAEKKAFLDRIEVMEK